jgi:hypothetical protein
MLKYVNPLMLVKQGRGKRPILKETVNDGRGKLQNVKEVK